MKRNYDFSKAAVIKGSIKSKSQVDNALKEQKTLTSIRLDSEIITIAKQKAQDDIEIARRKIELETQRAYLNLSTSIAQVQAYEQALLSSQSQVDSTKLGYEVGVRTSVDVLNAQQQLFSAKRDLLQARYNYLVNIIRLKASSGLIAEADLADINQQLVLTNAH